MPLTCELLPQRFAQLLHLLGQPGEAAFELFQSIPLSVAVVGTLVGGQVRGWAAGFRAAHIARPWWGRGATRRLRAEPMAFVAHAVRMRLAVVTHSPRGEMVPPV